MTTCRAIYTIGGMLGLISSFFGIGCATHEPYHSAPEAAALRELAPGESATVDVIAHRRWNPTHLRLHAGSTYLLEVRGKQQWSSGPVPTGAEGFWALACQWDEQTRRVPESQWNALIGTIDGWQDHPFVIGHRCVYTPLLSGELVCYANSDPKFIWNNHGKLTLTIERLTPTRAAPPPPPSTLPAWPTTQPLSGPVPAPQSAPAPNPGLSANDAKFQ